MTATFQTLTDEEFDQLRTNGTKVNYWAVCHRRLWLFSKGIRLEPLSERVKLGRFLHEQVYPDMPRREVLIDELIVVDVLHRYTVLEIKYSSRMDDAARLQIAYYLMYLRWLGAGELVGQLRFPKERRIEEVRLTPELEQQVAAALRDIDRIEALPSPPKADFMPVCRACAYCELCWG